MLPGRTEAPRGSELEPEVTLPWLVRLRWLGVVGQLVAIAAARFVFHLEIAWSVMAGVVALTLLSNVALLLFARRRPAEAATSRVMGSVLALDTVSLTLMLAAAGGPMNPFTVLYLVHITLSAVILRGAWTTGIAGLSVAGFGLLFVGPQDPHFWHRAGSMSLHLQGMWIAFVLAAALTAFFVRRVAEAIRHQHEAITRLQQANERQARLASLTTLAAGAAHELGSPLGTIAVAAHEAATVAARTPGAGAIAEDLRLIELEVQRCRGILTQMAAKGADAGTEITSLTVGELAEQVRAQLEDADRGRLAVRLRTPSDCIANTSAEFPRAVAALVQNALDASTTAPVVLDIAAEEGRVSVLVEDRGSGMPADVLQRVGEPFFTTKEPGRGLGLGLFLVRTFAESQGGSLEIDSSAAGTRARLLVPVRSGEQLA